MAINKNSGVKAAPASAMAADVASTSTNDLIEMAVIKKIATESTTTPILKRKGGGGSKRLQFTTPLQPYSTSNPITSISPRLIPSRRR